MSRWTDLYDNHAYRKSWSNLNSALANAKIDDLSVNTSVDELVRIKKAVSFLEEALLSVDPELARIFHEPSARPIFSTAVHRES